MTAPTKRMNPPARAPERAFTLLEVMAAMVVFLVGVTGILGLFATGLALHRDATHKTMVAIASDEVRARVEEALAEAVLDAGAELPVLEQMPIEGYPGYLYTATLTPEADEGAAGGVLADVFVYTVDAGQQKGERFKLYVRPSARPEALIRAAREGGDVPYDGDDDASGSDR